MNLLRGQRLKLTDLIDPSVPFTIEIAIDAPMLMVDFSCFGLDADSKLADDRYMSFYNQPTTPCGAVQIECRANNTATFSINLQKLPTAMARLVISAAVDGDGTMHELRLGTLSLVQRGVKAAFFTFIGNDFAAEKALMLMEIYRKEGHWRIWAQGQGFNGGLDALVRYFGGILTEPDPRPAPEQPITTPQRFSQEGLQPLITNTSPTNAPNDSHLNRYWKAQGTPIQIANITIDAGLLYFGSGLSSINSPSTIEPALINPKLPVDNLASANYQLPHIYSRPSYSELSPAVRAAYLKWLHQGRNDPLAHIGNVFLYFYGLERRALIDVQTDPTAIGELPNIIQEVKRLLNVYPFNGSFRYCATAFLEFLIPDNANALGYKLYLAPVPDFEPNEEPFPMELKLALGQLALDKAPVPADWAYAWLMAEPDIRLRTPAHRCPSEFKQLFMDNYSASFGKGLRLSINKTKIKLTYQAISPSFFYHSLKKTLDIPDVTRLTSPIKKLQELADKCSGALNAYSRYIGLYPDQIGTLDALLALPYTLWTEQQKQPFQTIKQTLETTQRPHELQFAQLMAWLPSPNFPTKSKLLAFINRLAEAGLGIEPDPRFGANLPNNDSKTVLFLDDGSLIAPTPRYTTAALTLHLAVVVALADGEVGSTEKDFLIRQIEEQLHLEHAEKNRLHAHLQWLLSAKPALKSVKKQTATLPQPTRVALANFLVLVAKIDNTVTPNEVKVLEKIYKLLDLDVQFLYGKLHGTGAIEPVTVRTATHSQGFTIPPPPVPTDVRLDMSRIAELKAESKKVTDMLVAIFENEAAPEILAPPTTLPTHESNTHQNLWGLDMAHSNFIRSLCKRVQWPRPELEELATGCGIMMLDGALEQINEAAFDAFDAAFTEGDDPIDINQELLKELLK